jgi:hypothetical protein
LSKQWKEWSYLRITVQSLLRENSSPKLVLQKDFFEAFDIWLRFVQIFCIRFLQILPLSDGDVFEFKCSTGLFFDIQRQICDFKTNVHNCEMDYGEGTVYGSQLVACEDTTYFFLNCCRANDTEAVVQHGRTDLRTVWPPCVRRQDLLAQGPLLWWDPRLLWQVRWGVVWWAPSIALVDVQVYVQTFNAVVVLRQTQITTQTLPVLATSRTALCLIASAQETARWSQATFLWTRYRKFTKKKKRWGKTSKMFALWCM